MKILIVCLPGIGDALMATTMIRLLKQKNPDAQIDVACMFGAVEYIFKNNPDINSIYRLPLYKENKLKGLRQIFNLRKNKYDISIVAFPAFRREYHLVHRLIGAKKRIAHKFQKGFWSELHFFNTNLVDVDEGQHNVINNLNLLKTLGIDWQKEINKEDVNYDLILDKEDIAFGVNYVKALGWDKENIIGIHPGSTDSPAAIVRRWPIERYAEVAKFLIKEKQRKILIFVGPDEAGLGKKLLNLIDDNVNCRLVDNLKFSQSIGLLNQITMLLCNDNGFGHVAAALGKKIVTLWASTNDKWSLPYNKKLVTLIRPEDFKPWYRYDLKRAIPKGKTGGMELIAATKLINLLKQ